MRKEKDFIGEIDIADDFAFGINTVRAAENFNFSNDNIRKDIFYAMIEIKKAAALANNHVNLIEDNICKFIIKACDEILENIDENIPAIHPLQGGAGTSTNMAANELVANIALKLSGKSFGQYQEISPLAHVNLSQSTNDTYGTAVKIALIRSLQKMQISVELLLDSLQTNEKKYAKILKIGRTELQDAMPLSLGQEFSAWAEAVSRFRWRLSKAIDWVREVNISGTAVGTGVNAGPLYSSSVIKNLREITKEPLALSRNLVDGTQNIDQIVEVSGLIKTGAVSIKKICSDLRLLSSGPNCGIAELKLPKLQAGSSIMPGKVNPVMLEAAEQVCIQVMGGDMVVSIATSESNLELPQFLPLIANTILTNNEIFTNMINKLAKHVKGVEPDLEKIKYYLDNSAAVATLLSPTIGYETAAQIVKESIATSKSVREIILEKDILCEESLNKLLSPEVMASPGVPLVEECEDE